MSNLTDTHMLCSLERPKTLKETALETLRDAITFGTLKPGERLVERVLCERLGVSRTVIRECFRHLESERLVTVIPNVGPSVRALDVEEVREIYDIRIVLEAQAVKACSRKADAQTIETLKQTCVQIETALAADDISAALRHTRSFYEIIFMTGNKSVSWDLVERLNSQISWLRVVTLTSFGRSATGPASLKKIIDCIADNDPDAAALACEDHITEASAIALRELDALS